MVGVAALASLGRKTPPLDEPAARALLEDEFPGRVVDGLWIAADGVGAIARSGDEALVLGRMGDGYVARRLPWTLARQASVKDGRVRLRFGEFGAPGAALALPTWPPQEQGA